MNETDGLGRHVRIYEQRGILLKVAHDTRIHVAITPNQFTIH